MEIETVTKEKMEALEALAQTNMKIGEARNTLSLIKAEEDAYLIKRETKALESIQIVLTESQQVLTDSFSNYQKIKSLSNDVAGFAQYLTEAYDSLKDLKVTFDQYTEAFETSVKNKHEELELIKRQMQLDKAQIKSEQKAIHKAFENIAIEKAKIKDGRETLERAFNRLKS